MRKGERAMIICGHLEGTPRGRKGKTGGKAGGDAHPNTAMKWLYGVERLALRAVAPRRAARRLRPPGALSDSGRPLCAGGVVAARPLPPPKWARQSQSTDAPAGC